MDYEAYLRVRTPSEPPFNQALSARYAIYRVPDSGRYSFRRLTLISAANRPILRVYVAFGGEAIRPSARLANAF